MATTAAFPPTPPGAFEIKTIPAGLLIESRAEEGGYYDQSGQLFRPLFRYISTRGIAMTVPVEADPETGKMRFWIAASEIGKADAPSNGVFRLERPAQQVASLGIRGSYQESAYREALETIHRRVAEDPAWQPAGEAYMVFWNGPMRPGFLKQSEIHLPVQPVPAEQLPEANGSG